MDKKILREAVALAEKNERLSQVHKLTAPAFERMAKEYASTDDARLDALKEALERPIFRYSNAFLNNSRRWCKEGTCSSPPRDPRRLSWLGRYEDCCAELSTVGSNPFELFALAARQVAKEHPEKFGTITDMDAHKHELEDTKRAYAEALKRIETGYAAEDLIVDGVDSNGYGRVSLTITKGGVHIGGPDWPEHLVVWLRQHPEAL